MTQAENATTEAPSAAPTPPAEVRVPVLVPPGGAEWKALSPGTAVRVGDVLLRDFARSTGGADTGVGGFLLPRSPLSGVVTGETTVRLTTGKVVPAVVVRTTPFQHEPSPRVISRPFTEQVRYLLAGGVEGKSAAVASLLSAGVWSDRPSCPDLSAQFADASGVDTVLCTVLDSDAHLGLSASLAEESAADVLFGGLAAAFICSATRLIVVVEPTVPDRIKRELSRLAAEVTRTAEELGTKLNVRAVGYANHYPLGDASMLLLRLLGRKLPPRSLPTTRGVMLLDAPAALAAGRATRHEQPLLQVPIGLLDHISGRGEILRVPVGTPISHLLPATTPADAQLRTGEVLQERVVAGPFDGVVISATDAYLHLLPAAVTPSGCGEGGPDPCIRCGWCVEACPTRVHPAAVLEAAQTDDRRMAERFGLGACIECGLCQYVCPSRLPLLGAIRSFTRGATP